MHGSFTPELNRTYRGWLDPHKRIDGRAIFAGTEAKSTKRKCSFSDLSQSCHHFHVVGKIGQKPKVYGRSTDTSSKSLISMNGNTAIIKEYIE